MANEALIWPLFMLCLCVSFILSGMEAGVFALSRLRIRQQIRAGRESARLLQGYLESPENFLWTILVGNTLANFLVLGWLLTLLHGAVRGRAVWFLLVYASIVFLFYTLFDLLPKMLFRKYPNRLCILLARPFRVIHWFLRPPVYLVQSGSDLLLRWGHGRAFAPKVFGNREELKLVMQDASQNLTSDEKAMIGRVLDFQSLTVRQSMKPMADVVVLRAGSTAGDALELCRQHNLTRFPVLVPRDNRERVVGIISTDDLVFNGNLDTSRPVTEFVRPALYLPEDIRLELAMRKMQRAGQRLAIIMGPNNREIGILSLQDVLNAIFGEVSQ